MKWYVAVPLAFFMGMSVLVWIGMVIDGLPVIRQIGIIPWIVRVFWGNGISHHKCHVSKCPNHADPRCRGALCTNHCQVECKGKCISDDQKIIEKMIDLAPIHEKFIKPPPVGRKVQI